MDKLEHYRENVDVNDKYNLINDPLVRFKIGSFNHINVINRRHLNVDDTVNYNQHLSAAVLGVNNILPECYEERTREATNTWTSVDAQEFYINTHPNNYLILAKPGLAAYTLGEAMAKERNSVHLCPRNLIIEEIEQKSITGRCLDFNMRHNREIKVNVLMPLLKKKLDSPLVRHRGYLISGFPLVSSDRNDMWYFKSMYEEESIEVAEEFLTDLLLVVVQKRKKQRLSISLTELAEQTEIEEEEEEEEVPEENEEQEEEEEIEVVIPDQLLEPCSDMIKKKRSYYISKQLLMMSQLNDLLTLQMSPTFYIYVTCTDNDAATKRTYKFLNYPDTSTIADPIQKPVINELRWPPKYKLKPMYKDMFVKMVFRKYKVRHPINFFENTAEQICNYQKNVKPFWDRKTKDIDPKQIVKIDARIEFLKDMLRHIWEVTLCNPKLEYTLIPDRLILDSEFEDLEEFWEEVKQKTVIEVEGSPPFNYYPSEWYNRCPVELKKRRTVIGKPRLAMKMFRHVFLLSSLDGLIAFYKNPRPYLDIRYLEPVCRVIITGTKSAGKTMLAHCLAWIFDSEILDYDTIYEKEKTKKFDEYSQTVAPDIIPVIEEKRVEDWHNAEAQRLRDLETWQSSTLTNLKKYIAFLSEFETIMAREQTDDKNKFFRNYIKAKERVSYLPFLDDLEQCKTALASRSVMEYAPAKLTIVLPKPEVPALGDPDVTEAILNHITQNDQQQEVDPSPESVVGVIVEKLKSQDNASLEANGTYCKYIVDGFPGDPDYWNALSDAKYLPDHSIALMENRSIDNKLIQNYFAVERVLKNYEERFNLCEDPLAKIKKTASGLVIKDKSYEQTVNDIVWEIIDSIEIPDEDKENVLEENITALNTSVDTFRENWDNAKLRLEEELREYIEVDLDFKTDTEILDEVLLQLRKKYYITSERVEDEEMEDLQDDEGKKEDDVPPDTLANEPRWLGELGYYCPIAYYAYGVLWEGKPDFCLKYRNKYNFFSKEECLELFQKDETKYEAYIKPYKKIPSWKICVMGCSGSGRSKFSKFIAKELGLMYIDFEEALNNYIIPKHFKRVGRKYENSFTEESLEEENVVEFAMNEENENFTSDVTYNENEIRRMIYNYLERGTPLLTALMRKVITRIWRDDPFLDTGFVLDGFPRLPDDVEEMVNSFCIPDQIIELDCDDETALQRLMPGMFKQWKGQQNKAKNIAAAKLAKEKQVWKDLITKEIVGKGIFEQLVADVVTFVVGPPQAEEVGEHEQLSNVSTDIDPEARARDELDEIMMQAYNELVELYPEPVDPNEWETNDDARDRIENRIGAVIETEKENISNLQEMLMEHRIKVATVNATKSFEKVVRVALFKLSWLRNRRIGIFEQTVVVSVDTAEKLISQGYYFISRFGRIGPVYLCTFPHTTYNPFHISRMQGTIFPVLHRNCVYFVHKSESVVKFRDDPLRYATSDLIIGYREYPVRISVIGPTKSGKSTLAARLAKEYGIICLSRGKAIRRILSHYHWCALAKHIHATLREGKRLQYADVVKSTQVTLLDYRYDQYGFVLEGFPEYPTVALELQSRGVYPLVVFDLVCSEEKVISNFLSEEHLDIIKYMPRYSEKYIRYRYSKWKENAYKIRDYINSDARNLYAINGNQARWKIFRDCRLYKDGIMLQIHYFISNVNTDLVIPANAMVIDNKTFMNKCSGYQNYCPACLIKKFLKHNNEPIDRKGNVQYRGLFYWICSEHMSEVRKNPKKYLYGAVTATIPQIPARLHHYDASMLYEDGICIVTYAEKLPSQIIIKGKDEYASMYKRKVYLFCGERCMRKFLARPHLYYDISVFRERDKFPKIDVMKLPDIGYLEQTLSELLTQACCVVNVLRPKYPGLDIKTSALLFIGLYLKVNNPNLDKELANLYKRAYEVYEARSKFILSITSRMRGMDNPFVQYPQCCVIEEVDDDAVLRMLEKDRKAARKAQIYKTKKEGQSSANLLALSKTTSSLMRAPSVMVPTLSSIFSLNRSRTDFDDDV